MNESDGPFASAAEFMSSPVLTVTPEMTIKAVVALLESKKVSGLPVVDEGDNLLGVLTEFDLLRAIRNLDLDGRVGDYMSTDVQFVDESATLTDLMEMLIQTRMRRVPVLRDGRVVGIVSRRDLVFVGSIRQQLLTALPTLPEFTPQPGQVSEPTEPVALDPALAKR